MSEARSRAAQDLVDDIAARSGIAVETTAVAVTLAAEYLTATLGDHRLADLRRRVPEFDELAAEGAVHRRTSDAGAAGGGTLTGRLFASVGGLVGGADGGPVSRIVTLIGHLGSIGLDVGEMRALASAMTAHVRARLGDAWVDTMIAKARAHIPILGRYFT